MSQCKNPSCEKETVSVIGRRPKEFCSVECRTKFHNLKNKKEGAVRGRPAGSKNKPKTEPTPPQQTSRVNEDELKERIRINNLPENKEMIENMRNHIADKSHLEKYLPQSEEGFIGILPAIEKKDECKDVERDARKNVTMQTIKEATEWKPKLSPFMEQRRKNKGGLK